MVGVNGFEKLLRSPLDDTGTGLVRIFQSGGQSGFFKIRGRSVFLMDGVQACSPELEPVSCCFTCNPDSWLHLLW